MPLLAQRIHRHARLYLAVTALATVLAGVLGAGVIGSLGNGGTSDPNAPSEIASRQIVGATGSSPQPGLVVLVRAPAGVASVEGGQLLARVLARMRAQHAFSHIASVRDEPRSRALLSNNARATLVLGYFNERLSEHAVAAASRRLSSELSRMRGVSVGGDQATFSELEETISSQLPQIELIAFSILLVLSLVAFRGLIAALLPLIVGAIAVAGSLLILRALAQVTTLSIYSLNLVTGLGLGLAIDYSLFIVYRYREELARCGHGSEALERTLATAGRTVAFSSLTVSAALLSLLVFPQHMLSSMGIAAAVVTLLAAAAALGPLTALLALLGPRVNALAPARLQRARRSAEGPVEGGRWYRLASGVMRRPVLVACACGALLLSVGLPAAHLNLSSVDARALPAKSAPRAVEAAERSEFKADAADPVVALVHAPDGAGASLASYRAELARLPGAALVRAPARIDSRLWKVELLSSQAPLSGSSQRLIGAIDALRGPYRAELAGVAAEQYDQHLSLRSHVELALLILAASTLLVLFAMTGSVVLAVKSLLMNLLTLSCAFGLLVVIFQGGLLQGALGYTATGTLEQTNMIILFIIAFGLSTDYGVFLLARIKEAHDEGASDEVAVGTGLERSGRVVSAAAMLFCAAVGSLAVSDVPSLKQFGIGAALAVIIDATLVRALLVPALMALLGRANWWAPRPMRAFATRSWALPARPRGPASGRPPTPAPATAGSARPAARAPRGGS